VVVDNARIERSVLGPGVTVGPGAEVVESVICDDVTVGADARVWRAVIDKRNAASRGATIGLDREADRRRFTVTPSGVTVVPKDAPKSPEFWSASRNGAHVGAP
jgi:glucose-1-phosphate adenylyltransferase